MDGGATLQSPIARLQELSLSVHRTHNPVGDLSRDARVMNSLKDKLREILGYFDTTKPVVFFDYPLHLNVGDLLIQRGTEQFFAENKIHIWKRYSIYDMPSSIRGLDDDVVIVCNGGGSFGDLYPLFHESREKVIRNYPHNPIVILPQTVHFVSPDRLHQSMEIFRSHRNCHIFARDARSLEILQRAGIQRTSAMPDMAHYLWGVLKPVVPSAYKSEPLRLVRRDKEAIISSILQGDLDTDRRFDWPTIVDLWTSRAMRLAIAAIRKQCEIGLHTQKYWQWRRIQDRAIQDGVTFFSRYRTIYTNRLHATLLGLLLSREVCAFDNCYGKLSSYRDTWLNEVKSLTWGPEEQR